MKESISNTRVSVLFYYDHEEEYARPVRLLWRGHDYELGAVKFWHTTQHGKTVTHHYTIADTDNEYTFQLALETENLTWRLERIAAHDETIVPFGRRMIGAAA